MTGAALTLLSFVNLRSGQLTTGDPPAIRRDPPRSAAIRRDRPRSAAIGAVIRRIGPRLAE